MKKISIHDDEQDMIFSQSSNHSVMQNRLRQAQKKKSSKPVWLMIVGAVIIYTATIYYIIDIISGSAEDRKVVELTQQVNKIKNSEKSIEAKISELEKDLRQEKEKSSSLAKIIEKGTGNANTQSAISSNPQPSNNQSPVSQNAAPLTLLTDQQAAKKRDYMTPQLLKISERRWQKPGLVPIPQGTVAQLKVLSKNSDGKKIQDIIYKDDETRKKRIQFQDQRLSFVKNKDQFEGLHLVRFNIKIDENSNQDQEKVERDEFQRVRGIHKLDEIKQQLPMCLVVPGYNNNAKFRLQYNLNSIFLQNYTNYFVVIINDASNDGSDELFRKYLDFYKISPSKYAYIQNSERRTALENIYMATHYYCSEDSVVINIDGDDEFIGKNVLKIFNAGYQTRKAGVVYSNFFWYEQGGNLMLGFTSEYTQNERDNNAYRQAPQRFSHLRSYRTELFRQVEAKDFQDQQGKFFTSAYDMAIYFPVMELSCGKISKIDGFHYLYNINTGLNDYQVDRNKQVGIDNKVRNSKKYTCYEKFKSKMDK